MEQNSVSQRIAHMVEYFAKGNKSAFAKTVGISNQSLGEIVGTRQSAPSFAALQKILSAFPQVRIEWFVFGRGSMLDLSSEALTLQDSLEGVSVDEIKQAVKSSKEQAERIENAESQIVAIQAWAKKFQEANIPAKLREAMKLPESLSKPKE